MLKSENIDWTGRLLGKSMIFTAPIPVITKDSKAYLELIVAINQFQRILKPADPREILNALAKLRLHFASSTMNEQELAMMLGDYLKDLAPYPKDILEQACIEYRQKGDSLFFPKIGQLLTLMKKHWYPRRSKLEKLKKLLEVSNQQSKE